MTEAEWLASGEPGELVQFVRSLDANRKLRLFACACCRRIWHLLTDPRSRRAVEASEEFADGLVNIRGLTEAESAANDATEAIRLSWAAAATRTARGCHTEESEDASHRLLGGLPYAMPCDNWAEEVAEVGFDARWAVGSERLDHEKWPVGSDAYYRAFDEAKSEEGVRQADLFRDIFGNPFRPVAFASEWRTDTVIALARQMYDSREFSAMPILADALQDAGCDNPDILNHCRGDGPHVRGCWVCDLVLGKE